MTYLQEIDRFILNIKDLNDSETTAQRFYKEGMNIVKRENIKEPYYFIFTRDNELIVAIEDANNENNSSTFILKEKTSTSKEDVHINIEKHHKFSITREKLLSDELNNKLDGYPQFLKNKNDKENPNYWDIAKFKENDKVTIYMSSIN